MCIGLKSAQQSQSRENPSTAMASSDW